MAKNYTIKEAVEIIAKGKDLEAITDIGRRFPVLAHKVAVVATKAGDEFVDLMGYMPDYLTANKVNSAIKAGVANSDETENDGEGAPATDETEDNGANEGTVVWNESMSGKQLWDILGKAGKRKLAKSTKKADLIEACKQAFGAVTEDESTDETNDAEDAGETNPYEGKSAMDLFKECKTRGIKVAPKKQAKYYADILVKDDAAKTEESTEAEDAWEDEEETPVEKKPAAKKAAKAKPAAKKTEVESDDGDDWDI